MLSLSDEDVPPYRRLREGRRNCHRRLCAAGLIDEHFHIGLGGYPAPATGSLRDMLGIRSEEFNILGEEAEGEPSEISLSNGLTTRLWQNDVTSVAADNPQCFASYYAGNQPPTGAGAHRHHQPPLWQRYRHLRWLRPQPSRHCPVAPKHLAPDGRSCRRSRLRVVKLQPIPPQIPASRTPSADPQTAPPASDFYPNRLQTSPSPSTVWKVIPSIAHRCETDAVGYTLNRNAILIAKTSC